MKKFLDKYNTVIFDMDGVITSEENYWNSAALVVREVLTSFCAPLSEGGGLRSPSRAPLAEGGCLRSPSRSPLSEGGCPKGREEFDPVAMSADVARIRREVFCDDRLITLLKGRGVNSNWDLGYVTVLIALILGTHDSEKILEYADTLSDNILDEYDRLAEEAARAVYGTEYSQNCSTVLCADGEGEPRTASPSLSSPSFSAGLQANPDASVRPPSCGCAGKVPDRGWGVFARNGELWRDMRDCFQEWFLGDELFLKTFGKQPRNPGKPGLIKSERPLIPMDKLKTMLSELSKTKRVCTGTGRPYNELIAPLSQWGITELFAPDGLSNYDHVAAAEAKTGETLTKPHPYMFLKALYGTDYDDLRLINGDYDRREIKKALIVGDAGADILAAHAMGADFCAVLTGVQGKAARGYFEDLGAEYILDSAAELI